MEPRQKLYLISPDEFYPDGTPVILGVLTANVRNRNCAQKASLEVLSSPITVCDLSNRTVNVTLRWRAPVSRRVRIAQTGQFSNGFFINDEGTVALNLPPEGTLTVSVRRSSAGVLDQSMSLVLVDLDEEKYRAEYFRNTDGRIASASVRLTSAGCPRDIVVSVAERSLSYCWLDATGTPPTAKISYQIPPAAGQSSVSVYDSEGRTRLSKENLTGSGSFETQGFFPGAGLHTETFTVKSFAQNSTIPSGTDSFTVSRAGCTSVARETTSRNAVFR